MTRPGTNPPPPPGPRPPPPPSPPPAPGSADDVLRAAYTGLTAHVERLQQQLDAARADVERLRARESSMLRGAEVDAEELEYLGARVQRLRADCVRLRAALERIEFMPFRSDKPRTLADAAEEAHAALAGSAAAPATACPDMTCRHRARCQHPDHCAADQPPTAPVPVAPGDAGLRHELRYASQRVRWLADYHVSTPFAKQVATELSERLWRAQAEGPAVQPPAAPEGCA